MNNKNYIILLSLFVACTGRAMQFEDLRSQDLLRYGYLPNDQLSDVYAVDKAIKAGVSNLRKAGNLTENTVLANIENALKPYESNPKIALSLQGVYRNMDKVVLSQVPCSGYVRKYDWNETLSRVALLTDDNDINVYEEKSRGIWVRCRSWTEDKPQYLYLVDNGKKLVVFREGRCTPCYDLDSEITPYSDEIKREAATKHRENIGTGANRALEWNIIKDMATKASPRTSEKMMAITHKGFAVSYTPTLQEIAKYLVSKAQ